MASNGLSSSGETPSTTSQKRNDELQRKRARDRKSQQAMRDRTKWQIEHLQEQVRYFTQVVGEKDEENRGLLNQLQVAESETEQLRVQNAALRLRLMGESPTETVSDTLPRWQIPPRNLPPACVADQIIQNFVNETRSGDGVAATSPGGQTAVYTDKPNLCMLLDKNQRPSDSISNITGDILLSYKEIDTLPKQVAVFYSVASLLKWQLLLDEASWKSVPPFFRPLPEQLSTPHAAWIDRIPWPRVRKYLIRHPDITLDTFAAVYSTQFNIVWPYDPSHVVISMDAADNSGRIVVANPVFEEQLRQIQNWVVTEAFRVRFPEMSSLIDEDVAV